MAVRLAIPAVVAADRGLDDALTIFGGRKTEETSMARMRRLERGGCRRRNRLSDMARDRVADELAKFLIRDFH